MIFKCSKCGKEICCSRNDLIKFKKMKYECYSCYTIITSKRYKPINTGRTGFIDIKGGLGDTVLFKALIDYYREENKNEIVEIIDKDSNINHFDKIFVANLHYKNSNQMGKWYSLTNEIENIKRMGKYLKLWFKPRKPKIELPEKYICIHIRNILKKREKAPDPKKNINREEIEMLNKAIIMPAVIVGDKPPQTLTFKHIDLTNNTTIQELAYIIQKAKLYIGKDSGPAHIAGCCNNIPMICWNYAEQKWFPKTKNESYFYLRTSKLDEVKNKIKDLQKRIKEK